MRRDSPMWPPTNYSAVVWTIVGILAIVALLIYILPHFH